MVETLCGDFHDIAIALSLSHSWSQEDGEGVDVLVWYMRRYCYVYGGETV
jgi:hypothetical protein